MKQMAAYASIPSESIHAAVSLVDVVSKYTDLKPRGHRLVGLCPLHTEKTPSFTIDQEKQLFYCHGCHAGGDVISFIQKVEGIGFKEALARLGLAGSDHRRPPMPAHLKQTARVIGIWRRQVSDRLTARLRAIGRRSLTIREQLAALPFVDLLLQEELKTLGTEWELLCDLHDDLWDSTVDLWKERGVLNALVGKLPNGSDKEQEFIWPSLTKGYRQRVAEYASEEEVKDERERDY